MHDLRRLIFLWCAKALGFPATATHINGQGHSHDKVSLNLCEKPCCHAWPVGFLTRDKAGRAVADQRHRKSLAQFKLRRRCAALIRYTQFVLSQSNVALPAEPKGYAYGVYAALRAMDQQQVGLILVEAPPTGDAWLGVNDRLRRAAFGSTGIIERFLKA
jgi:L-threonylcarbamoyladenylate synthase